MRKVLVNWEGVGQDNVGRLARYAEVVESWKLDKRSLEAALPEIDAALVLSWPGFMSREGLGGMTRLRLVQTFMVGVNHVPLNDLPASVVVCNNAGAFSVEVGEHAWGLLLAAAKKIVATHTLVRAGEKSFSAFREERDIKVLDGKTMGIIGFGGIGRTVAGYAKAFGMKVVALNRSRKKAAGVRLLYGRKGLELLLRISDAILISLPLTTSTDRLIGQNELGMMKKDAMLVNVARGDIVDRAALYSHLKANPSFRYATDVWWFKEGKETLETEQPFVGLPNFVGTPHTSGPTSLAGGAPQREAVDNVIRFLRGLKPRNVVDRSDYKS